MGVSELSDLATEKINRRSKGIHGKSTAEIVRVFHQINAQLPAQVDEVKEQEAKAIDIVFDAIERGNRLYLVGAGTSGRLAAMQAAECPPTFSTPAELIQAYMAGGTDAFFKSIEGAEDDYSAGYNLALDKFGQGDVVMGITASGRTPYVLGAIEGAKEKKVSTVSLTTTPANKLSELVDLAINVPVSAPAIGGSTRLNAATAQKMVLDTIISGVMIRKGLIYDGRMVAVNAKGNEKLQARATSIIMAICGVSETDARQYLADANYLCVSSIVMAKEDISRENAVDLLNRYTLPEIIG